MRVKILTCVAYSIGFCGCCIQSDPTNACNSATSMSSQDLASMSTCVSNKFNMQLSSPESIGSAISTLSSNVMELRKKAKEHSDALLDTRLN